MSTALNNIETNDAHTWFVPARVDFDLTAVPTIDALDLDLSGGDAVESHPEMRTGLRRLVPRASNAGDEEPPDAFRCRAYPWGVVARESALADLRAQGLKSKPVAIAGLHGKGWKRDTLDPWEVHRRLSLHNWDRGHAKLKQLLGAINCDLASFVQTYWLGGANFYRQFASREEVVRSGQLEGWDFIAWVTRKLDKSAPIRGYVFYDPELELDTYGGYRHLWSWEPPPILCVSTGQRPDVLYTPLEQAVLDDDADAVRAVISNEPAISQRVVLANARRLAARYGRLQSFAAIAEVDGMAKLLNFSFFVGARRLDALSWAAEHTEVQSVVLECVKDFWPEGLLYLIREHNADLAAHWHYDNALARAVFLRNVTAIRWLVAHGAPVEIGRDGVMGVVRPIAAAAQAGDLDVVKALVEGGADCGGDAIVAAYHSGHNDLVQYLIENGASPSSLVRAAACEADLPTLEEAVACGASVDWFGDGATGLWLLCEKGWNRGPLQARIAMIERLLALGADPDLVHAQSGTTPRELARKSRVREIMALFEDR